MDFIKTLGSAVSGAKNYIVEKNKKSAIANRLKTAAKCQNQILDRAYLALGKYYYNNLRDVTNTVTEGHCAQIEITQKKLKDTLNALEELYREDTNAVVREEIDLDDVVEIKPDSNEDEISEFSEPEMPLDSFNDEVAEGIVDEAVDTTAEFADLDDNSKLPFEG